MEWIKLDERNGGWEVCLTKPLRGSGPGVLIIPSIWGFNSFFNELCKRFSAEGFTAMGFDLYQGKTPKTFAEAKELKETTNRQKIRRELQRAASSLNTHPAVSSPKLGLAGFSYGANLGARLAEDAPESIGAVVLFYGKGSGSKGNSQAVYQFHVAGDDQVGAQPYRIKKYQEKLELRGLETELYIYPGAKHWFFESNRNDTYNPEAALLAWSRTIEFLIRNIQRAKTN